MMSCAVVRAAARDEQKCPKHVEANHSTPGEGTHSPESSLSRALSLSRTLSPSLTLAANQKAIQEHWA